MNLTTCQSDHGNGDTRNRETCCEYTVPVAKEQIKNRIDPGTYLTQIVVRGEDLNTGPILPAII